MIIDQKVVSFNPSNAEQSLLTTEQGSLTLNCSVV